MVVTMSCSRCRDEENIATQIGIVTAIRRALRFRGWTSETPFKPSELTRFFCPKCSK